MGEFFIVLVNWAPVIVMSMLAVFFVGLGLMFGFMYLYEYNLKKVYMFALIIILVINFVLALKYMIPTEPTVLTFGLLLTQLIIIPLIAWYRPEKDFEKIKEEKKMKEEFKQSVYNANDKNIQQFMKNFDKVRESDFIREKFKSPFKL